MKFLFLIPVVFGIFISRAQEKFEFTGKILNEQKVVEGAEIINFSSNEYTISNASGIFIIDVKQGDTLRISSLGLKGVQFVVSSDTEKHRNAVIQMTSEYIELDEVIIYDPEKFDAVSLGLLQKKVRKLTSNERKLKQAGDFKWYHTFSILGGALAIDPIINAINGRTKELKKNIVVEKKIASMQFIAENYTEYCAKTFELDEETMNSFLYYLAEQSDTQEIIAENNDSRIKFFLCASWFDYQKALSE